MTSNDHTHDALIAALRSPALREELAGEAAVVDAMCATVRSGPARSTRHPRRGIVVAVVTVASLGVGGLAAAGPGVLKVLPDRLVPDRLYSDHSEPTQPEPTQPDAPASDRVPPSVSLPSHAGADDGSPDDPAPCADGNHGATVSDAAQGEPADATIRGEVVSDVATADCGKPVTPQGQETTPGDTAPRGSAPADPGSGNSGGNREPGTPPVTLPDNAGKPPAPPAQQNDPPAPPVTPGQQQQPAPEPPGQSGNNGQQSTPADSGRGKPTD